MQEVSGIYTLWRTLPTRVIFLKFSKTHSFRKFFNLGKTFSLHSFSVMKRNTSLYMSTLTIELQDLDKLQFPISLLSQFPASFLQTLTSDFRPKISVAVSRFLPKSHKWYHWQRAGKPRLTLLWTECSLGEDLVLSHASQGLGKEAHFSIF